jgi:membrane protein involved in colicin uptake
MLKFRKRFRKLLLAHRIQTCISTSYANSHKIAVRAYNARKEYADIVIKEQARVLEIRKKQEEDRKKREIEERKQREADERRQKEEQKKCEELERVQAAEKKKQDELEAKRK